MQLATTMTECSMKSCVKSTKNSNYQKDGISFHRFPKCRKTKQKWIDATRRDDDWSPTNESVICSIHFTDDDFQVMKNRRRLRDSSVPTVNLPIMFSMDSSLRDYVIAEYKLRMQENNTGPPKSLTTPTVSDAKEKDKKDNDVKNKKNKPKKPIMPKKHKYGVGAGRPMKFIQLLANEKLRKRKKRR